MQPPAHAPIGTGTGTGTGWGQLPLFVSSTFNDMHAERDHLARVVFPELDERLRPFKLRLEPVDLRWGVETTVEADPAAKEGLVLRVCLDEVRRCHPLQLLLLGDREGWVPSSARALAAVSEAGLADVPVGVSVTELEVRMGLALPGQRLIAACRLPSVPHVGIRKLLEQGLAHPLIHYGVSESELRAFGQAVGEALWAQIEPLLEGRRSALSLQSFQRDRQGVIDHLDLLADDAVGRADLIGSLSAMDAQGWGVCLTGESGSGKSTVLACVHRQLCNSGLRVLAHVPDAIGRGSSVDALLRRWLAELIEWQGGGDLVPEEASSSRIEELFAARLADQAARGPVVVLLDALDRLEPTARGRFLTWLPEPWPRGARLVCSAVPCDASAVLATRAGCRIVAMPPMVAAEGVSLVEQVCARHHRQVNPGVAAGLLDRADAHPLWIKLATSALNDMDADDFMATQALPGNPEERLVLGLRNWVNALPQGLSALYAYLFERAVQDHGEPLRGLLGLLAVARRGWRERDVASLWSALGGGPADALTFARLRRSLRAHLVQGADGAWSLAHASARAALAPSAASGRWLHGLAARHLQSLPPEDPLRQSELAWHLAAAAEWGSLAKLVVADGAQAMHAKALADSVDVLGDADALAMMAWSGDLTPSARFTLTGWLQDQLVPELERSGRDLACERMLRALMSVWDRADESGPTVDRLTRRARAALQLGRQLRRTGTPDAAFPLVQSEVEAFQRHLGVPQRAGEAKPSPWQLADLGEQVLLLQALAGDLLLDVGRLDEAQAVFNRLLLADQLVRKADDLQIHQLEPLRRNADIALFYSRLAFVGLLQGHGHQAVFFFMSALDQLAALKRLAPGHRALQRALQREQALLLGRMGQALRAEGAHGSALRAGGAALQAASELVRADNSVLDWRSLLGWSHLWLGDAWHAAGKSALANAHWRRAATLLAALGEVGRPGLSMATQRLHNSAHPGQGEGEADDAGEAALSQPEDYQHPAVMSSSSEAQRTTGRSADEAERWLSQTLPGPGFGDWRSVIDGAQDAAVEQFLDPAGTVSGQAERLHQQAVQLLKQGAREAATQRLGRAADLGSVRAQSDLGAVLMQDATTPGEQALAVAASRLAAEQGDAAAQYAVGTALTLGTGVERDVAEACRWWHRAARQGMAEAQYNLGTLLIRGNGNLPARPSLAVRWLRRAARQGLALACHNLGHLLLAGSPELQRAAEGLEWLHKAANAGLEQAQHDLGHWLAWRSDPPDAQAALAWFRRAAPRLPEAAFAAGELLLVGAETVEPDVRAAYLCFVQAAEAGLAPARQLAVWLAKAMSGQTLDEWHQPGRESGLATWVRIGKALDTVAADASHVDGPSRELARVKLGAEQGDPDAQYLLGVHLSQTAKPPDFAGARIWYERASRQGNTWAMFNLAYLHLQQQLPNATTEQAIRWFTEAAELGLVQAQHELGVMYAQGQPVSQDLELAANWFRRAAQAAHAPAQMALAFVLVQQVGPEQPYLEARHWLVTAAAQGQPGAKQMLAKLDQMIGRRPSRA